MKQENEFLKSEIAYLRGKVEVYERFLRSHGFIKEDKCDWEDYEEPKEYWYINDLDGKPMKCELRYCPVRDFDDWSEKRKKIGNYFETKEEAEKAVEKLKAWKRLKNKGFMFELWDYDGYNDEVETGRILFRINKFSEEDKDLDLLFSGEDD